jgi:hypothetical protein
MVLASLTSRQRAGVAVVAAGAFAVAGASELRFVMPFGLLLAALGLPLLTVIAGRLRRRLSDPGAWHCAVLAAAAGVSSREYSFVSRALRRSRSVMRTAIAVERRIPHS